MTETPDTNRQFVQFGGDYLTAGEILEIVLCVIIAAQHETNPTLATQLRALANRILDQIAH